MKLRTILMVGRPGFGCQKAWDGMGKYDSRRCLFGNDEIYDVFVYIYINIYRLYIYIFIYICENV